MVGGRICLVAIAIVLASNTALFAQMSQADLREYTERAIRSGAVHIEKPFFTSVADQNGHSYPFSLGGVQESAFRSTYAGTGLLAIPLQEQFRVTAIRLYRNDLNRRQWWAPRLRQVELEISKMLDAVNTLDYLDAEDEIDLHNSHIEQLYYDAMIDAGIIKPNTVFERCYQCAKFYKVQITAIPENGIVQYMPAGDWDLYKFRTERKGETIPTPPWITVQQDSIEIGGKFYFSASWPGKRPYVRLIHVKDESPLEFRPQS